MLKINPLLYFILFLIYDILGKSSLLKWRLTNVLWSLTHQQKPKTLVRSTTWNDERLIWNCSWNKVAEGSIVFPACHLWFSISKKCWSLELENSGAPGRTLVPPHRDQSAGRAQFSVCKPSQRSKSDTDKRQTSIIFYFFYLNGQTTYTFLDIIVWDSVSIPHLITDSSGNMAHLHPTHLSDPDFLITKVSDADIHPWTNHKAEWGTWPKRKKIIYN